MTAATVETKRCTHCGEDKPTGEFYGNRANSDGFASWCKHCQTNIYKHTCRACGIRFGTNNPGSLCCSTRCADEYEQGPPVCVCFEPRRGWAGWECAACRRPYGTRFAEVREAWRAHLARNAGRAA